MTVETSAAQARPRVSVLTAVHNGARYLEKTIASVVAQTFTDFEYILVDDASTDASPAILASWAARDARIRLLHNPRALKPGGALNRGLAEARGEFVAILDHDDIALPKRLAKEVEFLDAHPTIGGVGSQVVFIDPDDQPQYTVIMPTLPRLVGWLLYFQCPITHSSLLVRRNLLEQVGGYSTTFWASIDYDLFIRLLKVTQLTNVPEILCAFRNSPTQISTRHAHIQKGQVVLLVQAMIFEHYGVRVHPARIALLSNLLNAVIAESDEQLQEGMALLDELLTLFIAKNPMVDEEAMALRQDMAWRYLSVAWNHRKQLRRASRELLARAMALDPALWKNFRQRLRNWRAITLHHR